MNVRTIYIILFMAALATTVSAQMVNNHVESFEPEEEGRTEVGSCPQSPYHLIDSTNLTENPKEDKIFYVVDQRAEYPGGNVELLKCVSHNIIYPEKAYEEGVEGRVAVSFVVEKSGWISNVRVERSSYPHLEEEAVRVVESIPKRFTPAKVGGEIVRSRFILPVSFRLDNPIIIYNRGYSYELKKDYAKALECYRRGSELGSAQCQSRLGYFYYMGYEVEKNYEEVEKWSRKAALQGDELAQFLLGVCYLNGYSVQVNNEEGVRWIKKAAEQGLNEAMYSLALCYQTAFVVSKDMETAIEWYYKATLKGSDAAARELIKLAEQGYASAQYNLGKCYIGYQKILLNHEKMVKWFKKSANQGYAKAQFALGECYFYGVGVDQSFKEAVKWYRKAALQGYGLAQFVLGECYAKGKGVKKNEDEAVKWFIESDKHDFFRANRFIEGFAKKGNEKAIEYLGW